MDVPSLETHRLKLRCPQLADWTKYASFMCSDNAQFMGGPLSQSEAWGWFCADIAQWNFYGHGALMIDHLDTGACLGQVCINYGPLFPEHELGWYLYPESQGNGYAYEAAVAIRTWAVESGLLTSLVSYIDPANVRSRRLAEKLGAVEDHNALAPHGNDLIYRHPIGK